MVYLPTGGILKVPVHDEDFAFALGEEHYTPYQEDLCRKAHHTELDQFLPITKKLPAKTADWGWQLRVKHCKLLIQKEMADAHELRIPSTTASARIELFLFFSIIFFAISKLPLAKLGFSK